MLLGLLAAAIEVAIESSLVFFTIHEYHQQDWPIVAIMLVLLSRIVVSHLVNGGTEDESAG